jgi:23S rRNA pseudouridine1911/1915/1917 synthase
MKIKILYEDANFLVIDKPAGIAAHADGRSKEKTITDWVLKNYPKIKGVGEPVTFNEKEIDRPGIVHRLDKDTSGVFIIVKTPKAFAYFKKQFMERTIKKVYHAIVSGSVKLDHGTINNPIGRSPSDFRKRLAGRGARGEMREAVTEYKVLKRFRAKCAENFYPRGTHSVLEEGRSGKNFECISPFTYLEIKPKTGRTHQIRVHMKYLNHPVVADTLYNPNSPCPKGITRLALHAKSIEFKDLKGKIIKIESPIPVMFKKVVK